MSQPYGPRSFGPGSSRAAGETGEATIVGNVSGQLAPPGGGIEITQSQVTGFGAAGRLGRAEQARRRTAAETGICAR